MSTARALSVGHFDGVHLGHAALVRAAREAVGPSGEVVVLAFDPHPLDVLRPSAAPQRLSSLAQRRRWLLESGADEVVPLRPTRELLGQSPETFVAWLADEHAPQFVVEGLDFRFGRDRAGSVETLKRLERRHGYRTLVIDDIETALTSQTLVSVRSSLVRWLIARGRVRDARALLGRPYEMEGPVMPGDGRGAAALGVATANLDHGTALLPADGVYAGTALTPDGQVHPAAISVGRKPTFGENPRVCEAHLIGHDGEADQYGWTLRLGFRDWLRDQIAYPGPEPLIEQLQRDLRRASQAVSELAQAAGAG